MGFGPVGMHRLVPPGGDAMPALVRVYHASMDLETALADADAALAVAEQELVELRERIEALTTEKRGLELSLARHRGEPAHPKEATKTDNAWTRLARTNAIIKVMEDARDPLSPADVVRTLSAVGREGDTSHNVSAALSYLQGQKKVRSLGRGRWVLAETPLPSVDDVGADPDADGNRSAQESADQRPTPSWAIPPGDPRSVFHPPKDKEVVTQG